jgi:hypothetical protein
MPTIFDNIVTPLLPTLRQTLVGAYRADICVGYFNLRGWAIIHDLVENFDGSETGRARVGLSHHLYWNRRPLLLFLRPRPANSQAWWDARLYLLEQVVSGGLWGETPRVRSRDVQRPAYYRFR